MQEVLTAAVERQERRDRLICRNGLVRHRRALARQLCGFVHWHVADVCRLQRRGRVELSGKTRFGSAGVPLRGGGLRYGERGGHVCESVG